MSVIGNQQRILLGLLAQLRPQWRKDRNLPARIQNLLSSNRAFGSRDRRLYRELIYTTLRYLPWIEPLLDRDTALATQAIAWLAAEVPSTQRFREALVREWGPCPMSVAEKAALLQQHVNRSGTGDAGLRFSVEELLPSFLHQECPEAFESAQLDALLARAPLWLRVQPASFAAVTAEFDRLGWRWKRADPLPYAVQMLDEVDVTKSESFLQGGCEIQDLGSQLLLESAAVQPGQRWYDACAGAGGKTLQLAHLLGPSGHVDAFDIRPDALTELGVRAQRAKQHNIQVLAQASKGVYDGALVDAPCTGSGTWRRSPHLKWITTTAQIGDAAKLQLELISRASERVAPGGRLVYATCSLHRSENDQIISTFLSAHPEFYVEPPARDFGGLVRAGALTLLPAVQNTDGFFVAALRRRQPSN